MALCKSLLGLVSAVFASLVLTAASCSGGQTETETMPPAPPSTSIVSATTQAPTTTTAGSTTTTTAVKTTTSGLHASTTTPQPLTATSLPSWVEDGETAALHDFLLGSGQVPSGAEVIGAKISGEWAGAFISDQDFNILPVLLRRSEPEGWSIINVGTQPTFAELEAEGAPAAVANYLACDT